MKKQLPLLTKGFISAVFLFLLFSRIDAGSSMEALKNSRLPFAVPALAILVMLLFPLALRLFLLLKINSTGGLKYLNILKLTAVGIFFNNFLPTGAGGDIAKAFFLVRGEEKKLLIGSSVLVDRFLGALTVISMGAFSAWINAGIPAKHRFLLSALLFLLLSAIFFFTNKKAAFIFYSAFGRFMSPGLKIKLQVVYRTFYAYFSLKRTILYALGISFLMQIIAIAANYLIGVSLAEGKPVGLSVFFTYIPLIWTATLIPSLGGLGVREFTYMYFFSGRMGEEQAVALSILVLLSIAVQSVIGGITLLCLKMPDKKTSQ